MLVLQPRRWSSKCNRAFRFTCVQRHSLAPPVASAAFHAARTSTRFAHTTLPTRRRKHDQHLLLRHRARAARRLSVALCGVARRGAAPSAAPEVDLKEVLNKWDNDEDGDSKECMQGAELEFFTDRIELDVLPALEQLMERVRGDVRRGVRDDREDEEEGGCLESTQFT